MPASTRFFSDAQLDLAASAMDRIVPPNEKMPGGGEIAVEFVDRFARSSPRRKRLFGEGLAQVEAETSRRYSLDFPDLTGGQQDEILRQVEADHPEFFDLLVRQTYNGYYTNPKVVELIGMEPRPPQPTSHRLEMGDLTLIENVKRRGIAYREV